MRRVHGSKSCLSSVFFVCFFVCFLVTILASHHTKWSNTPVSNTSTPLECTLTPKRATRSVDWAVSFGLIRTVHASVGKLTHKVSSCAPRNAATVQTRYSSESCSRVTLWRNLKNEIHSKPKGHTRQLSGTLSFKAIVVCLCVH